MEVYYLDYSNYKMYNPSTGEFIIDEVCDDNAKDLIAYFLGDYSHYNDETLKAAWLAFMEKNNVEEDNDTPYWDALVKFLEEYESEEWIAYKIFSSGIACGIISYYTIYVVKKSVIVIEEMDDDEDDADYDHFIVI